MGPQNRHDGKHPDAMIRDSRALVYNTQDKTQGATTYSGTQEVLKHTSRNKMYLSDEQLYAVELCINHGINIQADGVDGERISQIC